MRCGNICCVNVDFTLVEELNHGIKVIFENLPLPLGGVYIVVSNLASSESKRLYLNSSGQITTMYNTLIEESAYSGFCCYITKD